MITEAKTLLTNVITANTTISTIVTTAYEEQSKRNTRDHRNNPYVSIITNQGDFDDRKNKWEKRYNQQSGKWEQRYTRGVRRVPLTLKVFALDEPTADTTMATILAHIPREWTYKEHKSYITIGVEDHADKDPSIVGEYISQVSILFEGIAVQNWKDIPTATQTKSTAGVT